MQLYPAHDYQASLNQRYHELCLLLSSLVPEGRLEHIGSSAIPGAISKGDLDICLIVPAALHATVVARLTTSGYQAQTDTLRTAELCMLNAPAALAAHALQVVATDSEFADFIHFRDALRAHPALVERYNSIKLEYAKLGEAAYRLAKTHFIEEVLAAYVKPI